MILIRFLVTVLSLAAASLHPAWAHVVITGLVTVEVQDGDIVYRLTAGSADLPEIAASMLDAAAAGDQANAERLAELGRAAVSLTAGAEPCRAGRTRIQGGTGADGRIRLELYFACPAPGGALTLKEDWRPVFGEHYSAILSVAGAQVSRAVAMEQGGPPVRLDLAAPDGGWIGFISMGVGHILTGFDHLLFLLALLVNQSKVWPVARIVTAFTLAHSITLSLAVLGLVAAPDWLVEPLIAASIVWVALENLLFAGKVWRRAGIAFLFGLIHGLGFASALTELELTPGALARALIGFNAGVELGQIACILIVLPVLVRLTRFPALTRLPRVVSVLIAATGGFWFLERVLGG